MYMVSGRSVEYVAKAQPGLCQVLARARKDEKTDTNRHMYLRVDPRKKVRMRLWNVT